MKRLVLALAVLFMIIGGAVSVMKWMKIGPFEDVAATEQVDQTVQEARKFLNQQPIYVDMDALTVPIIGSDSVTTYIIQYRLEVFGSENERLVYKSQLHMHNALLRDFSYYLPQTLRNNQGLDMSLIKHRIMMVADKVFGKDVVSDALVQNVTQPGS